ncbi:PQQ-dependent sugar dehydrogenase [Zobellia galactanivorans]|uniref:c-type cytochrome n=1 Tax=Zobellia galactanivorans (strain DSM 12802 / CCUG 47099 / CIP 106680 / NCIMB 13871 / Dsij) TaxID=63186 RepID=UPI0026E2C228|nr:c-type cytochrome [Zobellia galactanivorans]MDO6810416.1 PQQ-dependent sugar dehydrogenase [Zobellia galactanivorans]
MNPKTQRILVVLFFGVLAVLIFYPNRVNRYVKRKYRAYITVPKGTLNEVFFQKVELGSEVKGLYTSLVFGPDHKLYAGEIDGKIKRFQVQPSGELRLEHTFKPYGEESKFSIGLAFDPASTSDSLIVWVTYSETSSNWAEFPDSHQDFDGEIWAGCMARLRLSSTTGKVVRNDLILKGLPRFGPNEENFANSIVFGPDRKLYFGQGANTGMGWCDCEEGQAPSREALLSGTVLCLNTVELPEKLPIVVKTVDGGGSYDPYDVRAPLKIYATGLRNAYDMVWHSNGQLYTTINGSGGNENTPSSDPKSPYYIPPHPEIHYTGPKDIPAIIGAQPDQNDFMARVEEGGYYGHPNPLRAEYVLNHGGADLDNYEYKGVEADSNFRGFAYDFGPHVAPAGIIEYRSKTFEGKLKGCLIVARMGRNDLVLLRPGGEKKDIVQDYDGSAIGLDLEGGPLDLVEDLETGNIYVSGFGSKRITLFHPLEKESDRFVQNEGPVAKSALEKGREIYEVNCQLCHGVNGKGAIGPSLVDKEWGNGEDDLSLIIKNGSGDGSMPAWKHKLSENQIKWVEQYVLSLEKDGLK